MSTINPQRRRLSAVPARAGRTPVPFEATEAARNAAYRRLTAVVLGLDVSTLARQLRAARDGGARLHLAA